MSGNHTPIHVFCRTILRRGLLVVSTLAGHAAFLLDCFGLELVFVFVFLCVYVCLGLGFGALVLVFVFVFV